MVQTASQAGCSITGTTLHPALGAEGSSKPPAWACRPLCTCMLVPKDLFCMAAHLTCRLSILCVMSAYDNAHSHMHILHVVIC